MTVFSVPYSKKRPPEAIMGSPISSIIRNCNYKMCHSFNIITYLVEKDRAAILCTNKFNEYTTIEMFTSLLSLIYRLYLVLIDRAVHISVQNLPLSYAVLLNFATPIVASIGAKIILHEKLAFLDFGGSACSTEDLATKVFLSQVWSTAFLELID
ncbi:uncharacterized protein LOC103714014 [Phoenix dactylifera]|uniref:Uncharacterized protein LOC103714014 n=1 Tax=Phoenix dactylifera TaxID=42345 RepID=A0A8B8ZR38_PHODC|nr:uncharacterized protein LOC103714014 [Phoenix dactylifera]